MYRFENYNLKEYNTFGIEAFASVLYKIDSEETLLKAIYDSHPPYFILGGGSNLLLSKNQELTILKNEIKGIEISFDSEKEVIIKVGGGEEWHGLVMWATENNYGGIENLSLIPGTVGAAPIQNIGAYGVELEDVFHSLDAISLADGHERSFNKEDCEFGYRDSIFKRELKGKYFISNVSFRLTKEPHKINTSYGAIMNVLNEKGIIIPTIQEISKAVIEIRKSKLPNPKEIGNSGSFFKNPIINMDFFEKLKKEYPNIPSYPVSEEKIKIPAGWLIDQAGWKGKRINDAGCYKNQALVLVNHGNASGKDILDLAEMIIQDVHIKFGIRLSPEVNIL